MLAVPVVGSDLVLTVHVLSVCLMLTVPVTAVALVLTGRAVRVGLVLYEHKVDVEVEVHMAGVVLLTEHVVHMMGQGVVLNSDVVEVGVVFALDVVELVLVVFVLDNFCGCLHVL